MLKSEVENMKFGVCRGLDDFDAIKSAATIGADFLECGFGSLARFDDSKFNECKSFLEELSFPCPVANGFIPGEMSLVGVDIDYGSISDYLDKGFERARLLGVEKIVFGSGKARSYPEDFSKQKAEEQLLYFLNEFALPRAEKAGCMIVTEPLRFCESSMIHTVSDGVGIAKKCNRDNIYTLADLYHVYGNSDNIDKMKGYNGLIKHAHIAEPVTRRYPDVADTDEIKSIYKAFIDMLVTVGCETLSVEARTDCFSNDLISALNVLKTQL